MSNQTAHTNETFVARAKRFAGIAGIFVILVGALSLTGWLLDIDGLKSIYGNITMKANAAVSLVLAGGSLWLLDVDPRKTFVHRAGQVCAATITLVGALTLIEHIVGASGTPARNDLGYT